MYASNDIRKLKGALTLDFNQPPSKMKKDYQLTTPDMEKLVLSTPELTNIAKECVLKTPLKLMPKYIQDADDDDDSNNINDDNNRLRQLPPVPIEIPPPPPRPQTSSSSHIYHHNNNNHHHQQTSNNNDDRPPVTVGNKSNENSQNFKLSDCSTKPSSATLPINMEDQEKCKLERKRLRNRIAASKCRQKKLERINTLQRQVNLLKDRNSELDRWSDVLQEINNQLDRHIEKHRDSGCHVKSQFDDT